MHDSILTFGLFAGSGVLPLSLTYMESWRRVFSKEMLEWKPLGLCLGLASVGIGQGVLIAYHRLRWNEEAGQHAVQGKHTPYRFWDGVREHFCQPEGVLALVGYLTVSWIGGFMRSSYYSFEGGIQWKSVAKQLVVQDVLQTGIHYLEHQFTRIYKSSHKPHHKFLSPKIFDAFNGSLADTFLMIIVPLFATQRIVAANLWSYITFGTVFSSWLVLIHSEWHHPWDPLFSDLGLGTPGDHHVHHAIFNRNFGHLFTFWDRLMGTYTSPGEIFKSGPSERARRQENEESKPRPARD
eukprot:TRINITY_DN22909_c0_g1_i1.p1 TRINITY_DN22909_c0_g1~~TRINITY_DN22909_c0_g1_i1.p1  ORF type:complete len:303 (+),score=8.20 TRINITY_DN22909_c0_g1_i1:25-909(+)